MIISDSETLVAFCVRQRNSEFITVDTEFMRERTYWPRLCLIQVGGATEAAAIDPLADVIDLSPLYALMADTSIMKVFHAARQDLEIFCREMDGTLPCPIFDTQVAATVCGFGAQVSYETLVNRLCHQDIDKSSRFTDWARRPLSERQIEYALGDVTYLRTIYESLRLDLQASQRSEWLSEEMAALTNPALYSTLPEDAWKKIKIRSSNARTLAVLQALAAWREREAQRQNLPRNWVVKDDALVEMAHTPPATAQDLTYIRGIAAGFADSRQGEEILRTVAEVLSIKSHRISSTGVPRKAQLGGKAVAVVELLKVLLKQVSEEHGVAPRLIASNEDLESMAREDTPQVAAMQGWRFDMFGRQALALKRGEIALVVGVQGVEIYPIHV